MRISGKHGVPGNGDRLLWAVMITLLIYRAAGLYWWKAGAPFEAGVLTLNGHVVWRPLVAELLVSALLAAGLAVRGARARALPFVADLRAAGRGIVDGAILCLAATLPGILLLDGGAIQLRLNPITLLRYSQYILDLGSLIVAACIWYSGRDLRPRAVGTRLLLPVMTLAIMGLTDFGSLFYIWPAALYIVPAGMRNPVRAMAAGSAYGAYVLLVNAFHPGAVNILRLEMGDPVGAFILVGPPLPWWSSRSLWAGPFTAPPGRRPSPCWSPAWPWPGRWAPA